MPVPQAAGWVRVWPAWQRGLHAVLGLAIVTALVTHEGGRVHEAAGYAALAMATMRVLAGLWGPAAARFAAFVRGPAATLAYTRAVRQGRAPRYLNHNPLGAWMVLALLVLGLLAGVSGALYVTDRFWGEAWVMAWHAAMAWPLVALVPLHVAGVVHASRAHHENLAAAMVHGRKPQRPGDV